MRLMLYTFAAVYNVVVAGVFLSIRGFFIVAAPLAWPWSGASRSIVQYKCDEDKLTPLDNFKLLGATGPTGDRNNFCEYIQKNMHLYELRTGVTLSTHAAAAYTRNQLAESLRRNPYQVSLLLGGWDATEGPSMYYLDYLGSMHRMQTAAHGHASYFALSILDRYWRENMSVDEALDVLRKCFAELKTRYVLSLQEFKIKVVDKNGIRDLFPDPPAPEVNMGKLVDKEHPLAVMEDAVPVADPSSSAATLGSAALKKADPEPKAQ